MKFNKLVYLPFLMVPLIASCNGSQEYNVKYSEINGLVVSNYKAEKGRDYTATLSIDQTVAPGVALPKSLTKVTSGNSVLTANDYSYQLKEDTTADFCIPAQFVVGDIDVQLTVIEPVGEEYTEIKWKLGEIPGLLNGESYNNISFKFETYTADDEVQVDWGDGKKVTVTSPATSPTFKDDDDLSIKVYGKVKSITFNEVTYDEEEGEMGEPLEYGNLFIYGLSLSKYVIELPDWACGILYSLENEPCLSNLKSLGAYAFGGTLLKSITLPKTLENMSNAAFLYMYHLESIKVEEGNENFAVMNDCLVNKKDKVLVLAFSRDSQIPNNLGIEEIAQGAFASRRVDDERLNESEPYYKNIIIPNTVKKISLHAFIDSTFEGISFEKGPQLKYIGEYCFNNAVTYGPFSLPDSVEEFAEGAFGWCDITFANKTFILPSSLKKIGKSALCYLGDAEKVVLNANLEEIGEEALYHNGSSLKYVDATSFTTAKYPKTVGKNAFRVDELARYKIYVSSDEVKNTLSKDDAWKDYSSIIEVAKK